MSKILHILVLIVFLAACTTPGPTPERQLVQPSACETLKTLPDGSTILLCPPPAAVSTDTPAPASDTPPGPTATRTRAPRTPTVGPTSTPVVPSSTPDLSTGVPTPTLLPAVSIAPYISAPLCPDHGELHNHSQFHTVWDDKRGCHYDHEHGTSPFTDTVAAAFPDFDLKALLGGVEIGHTNPSSPVENVVKHEGFKWDVSLKHGSGECVGREKVPVCVISMVVQYHTFGNYQIEFLSRVHSAVALMKACVVANSTDCGYGFFNMHQDYGQRVSPYQAGGAFACILDYPDSPVPPFEPAREPYFSVDPIAGPAECGADRYQSRAQVVAGDFDSNSTWISEAVNVVAQKLFFVAFRLRDAFQMLLWGDGHYPFVFTWLCSNDDGLTYAAKPGCRFNNSTTRVHEIGGEIPKAWDGLAGWDTDPSTGHVTVNGFVTQMGQPVAEGLCVAPGVQCFPLKLSHWPTGKYGSATFPSPERISAFDPINLPERDICFKGGVLAVCDTPGAKSSGWIGANN